MHVVMEPPAAPAAAPTPAGPSRALLGVALVFLLAGLGLTLYAVVHRPDYVVLVGLDKAEVRWLQPRMDKFAEAHHVRIALRPWADRAELLRLLARDRSSKPP